MIEVEGPIEVVLWLAVLEPSSGSQAECLVCRAPTAWVHPEHGGVHPQCIEAAMRAVIADEEVTVLPATPGRQRGAYSRRGMVA